ncbi:MAG: hypothetical protein ACKO2P_12890 [Planctomycetota bacterium]
MTVQKSRRRLQNLLAVIAGVVAGSVVNMTIVSVGPVMVPLPEGVDLTDMQTLPQSIQQLSPQHFIAPWLAHALGTLVGAFVAAKLATGYRIRFALAIGFWFLLGGVTMVWMVGGPIWFTLLDLLAAYLPMAFAGGLLAKAQTRTTI